MPDSFNRDAAAQRHNEIISEVERIRNGLTRDVINYYYSDPVTEDEETAKREGIRKYLRVASDEINSLLNGKLN